jgi:hypothetical protein
LYYNGNFPVKVAFYCSQFPGALEFSMNINNFQGKSKADPKRKKRQSLKQN